jgi:hypothetical protein
MMAGDGARDAVRAPEDFFADALAAEQGHGGLLLFEGPTVTRQA